MRILGKRILSNSAGLTFVEMLISSALVGIIAVSVYGMLASGIKVWQAVNQDLGQIDSNIAFDKLDTDLHNIVSFKNIVFQGTDNEFSFACVSKVQTSTNGFDKGVGRVRYFFDADRQGLFRQYVSYDSLFSLEQPESRMLIGNIRDVLISYCFYDEQKKTFLWTNTWPPDQKDWLQSRVLPVSLRIAMMFSADDVILKKIKTIDIPVGALDFDGYF